MANIERRPAEYKIVGKAMDKKLGLSIDGMRQFVSEADAAGLPGDTPITQVGVTIKGRLHRVIVEGVPR